LICVISSTRWKEVPADRKARPAGALSADEAAASLDDAKQPQDEDQQQDAAKTDIHDTLLLLVLRE
jgi:hypothetical protein